ncbi:hypothetical protein FKW77_004227 [Venturia effusa]|uniref:SET domain-containing protein n=1 Tax=Venturia effusa TaxID=50376 RepID=A0A517L152_9PEZI|nr:hypothetical protein FKW77_004227 [Venturia effusa]
MSEQPPAKRRVAPDLLSSTTTHPYKIQQLPNKGLGLIATQTMTPLSTIVLQEDPILRIPATMDENDDTALQIWLERYLLTMPAPIADLNRKATFALLNAHPEKGPLAGILQTNGFQLPAEEEWPECRGLFVTVSRINHSCVPNCAQRWDAGRSVMMVMPVRGIEVGEEITLSYLEGVEEMSIGERRESLLSDFGFWCECELCVAEGGSEGGQKNDVAPPEVNVAVEKAGDAEHTPEKARVGREKENKSLGKGEKPAWKLSW